MSKNRARRYCVEIEGALVDVVLASHYEDIESQLDAMRHYAREWEERARDCLKDLVGALARIRQLKIVIRDAVCSACPYSDEQAPSACVKCDAGQALLGKNVPDGVDDQLDPMILRARLSGARANAAIQRADRDRLADVIKEIERLARFQKQGERHKSSWDEVLELIESAPESAPTPEGCGTVAITGTTGEVKQVRFTEFKGGTIARIDVIMPEGNEENT